MRICGGVLSLLLMALPAIAQQEAALSADQIVQKQVEALGGIDKLTSLQAVRITGTATLGGGQVQGPFTLAYKKPASMRVEFSIQGLSLVQAMDGVTVWSINAFQGSTEPQKADAEDTKSALEDTDFEGPLVNYKDKGHTVELAGREDVGGTAAYKLKLTKKSGQVDYVFVDAQKFLPVKHVSQRRQMGRDVEMESLPANFKPVGGLQIAHSLEQKANGQTVLQMSFDKVEVNPALDDALFRMPEKQPERKP